VGLSGQFIPLFPGAERLVLNQARPKNHPQPAVFGSPQLCIPLVAAAQFGAPLKPHHARILGIHFAEIAKKRR
jgi:hypothetical protein